MSGAPSNNRNNFTEEQMKRIQPILEKHDLFKKVFPISKFVKVDKTIPGCPVIEEMFLKEIDKIVKK